MFNKLLIATVPVILSNLVGFSVAFFLPVYDLNVNIDSYGSAISSFSGTIFSFLIAALTVVLGLNGDYIKKFRKYSYFNALIFFYFLVFFELGAMFFAGILCFADNVDHILYISLSLSLSCFILLFLVFLQFVNISKLSNN